MSLIKEKVEFFTSMERRGNASGIANKKKKKNRRSKMIQRSSSPPLQSDSRPSMNQLDDLIFHLEEKGHPNQSKRPKDASSSGSATSDNGFPESNFDLVAKAFENINQLNQAFLQHTKKVDERFEVLERRMLSIENELRQIKRRVPHSVSLSDKEILSSLLETLEENPNSLQSSPQKKRLQKKVSTLMLGLAEDTSGQKPLASKLQAEDSQSSFQSTPRMHHLNTSASSSNEMLFTAVLDSSSENLALPVAAKNSAFKTPLDNSQNEKDKPQPADQGASAIQTLEVSQKVENSKEEDTPTLRTSHEWRASNNVDSDIEFDSIELFKSLSRALSTSKKKAVPTNFHPDSDQFAQLPPHILKKVFQLLQFQDHLNIRLVNKRSRIILDQLTLLISPLHRTTTFDSLIQLYSGLDLETVIWGIDLMYTRSIGNHKHWFSKKNTLSNFLKQKKLEKDLQNWDYSKLVPSLLEQYELTLVNKYQDTHFSFLVFDTLTH